MDVVRLVRIGCDERVDVGTDGEEGCAAAPLPPGGYSFAELVWSSAARRLRARSVAGPEAKKCM